jgi:hypothetical protein
MRACYVLSAGRVLSSMQQRLRGGASKCRTAASVRAAVGAPPPHPPQRWTEGRWAFLWQTAQNCHWNNIAPFEFGIRIVGVPFPPTGPVPGVHKLLFFKLLDFNSVKNMLTTVTPPPCPLPQLPGFCRIVLFKMRKLKNGCVVELHNVVKGGKVLRFGASWATIRNSPETNRHLV